MREDWFEQCTGEASLRYPEFLDYSAWIEHTPFAFWIVDAIRPGSFAELGTHQGQSYLTFCEALGEVQPAQAYAIDTWQGDEHAGFYGAEILAKLRSNHDAKYGSFSRLLQMTFTEAAERIPDRSIDLLHIDGRHFADDVRHDFEEWLPKLSPRGVVLMHDTTVFERGFGVHEVWADLQSKYPSFEFHHGHGLGVLAVGSDIPDKLSAFLEASSEVSRAKLLRDFYSRQGRAVSDRYDLIALKDTATERLEAIHRKNARLERTKKRVEQLNQKLTRVRSKRNELGERLAASQSEVRALKASASWKITKPIRAANAKVRHRNSL